MKILITDIPTSRSLLKKKIGFSNSYNWYQIIPSPNGTGLKRKYWVLASLTYTHNISGERIIETIPAWIEKDLRTYPINKQLRYRWFDLTN